MYKQLYEQLRSTQKQHSFHRQNDRYDCPGPLNFIWQFHPIRLSCGTNHIEIHIHPAQISYSCVELDETEFRFDVNVRCRISKSACVCKLVFSDIGDDHRDGNDDEEKVNNTETHKILNFTFSQIYLYSSSHPMPFHRRSSLPRILAQNSPRPGSLEYQLVQTNGVPSCHIQGLSSAFLCIPSQNSSLALLCSKPKRLVGTETFVSTIMACSIQLA